MCTKYPHKNKSLPIISSHSTIHLGKFIQISIDFHNRLVKINVKVLNSVVSYGKSLTKCAWCSVPIIYAYVKEIRIIRLIFFNDWLVVIHFIFNYFCRKAMSWNNFLCWNKMCLDFSSVWNIGIFQSRSINQSRCNIRQKDTTPNLFMIDKNVITPNNIKLRHVSLYLLNWCSMIPVKVPL